MLIIKEKIESICGAETMAYTFGGVKFKREAAACYTTNGKQALKYEFDPEEFAEVYKVEKDIFIPLQNWKNIRKNSDKGTIKIVSIDIHEDTVIIKTCGKNKKVDVESFILDNDIRYPEVDNYIKEEERYLYYAIIPKDLLELHKATQEFGNDPLILGIPVDIKNAKLSEGPQRVHVLNKSITAFTMPVKVKSVSAKEDLEEIYSLSVEVEEEEEVTIKAE